MSNDIVLTNAIRQNLLALQKTGEMQAKVQERLSTGKKVNSALDNPTNFFMAASLTRRAGDLSSLLDGMSNGIKTLEATDSALKGISKTVETMRAYVRQARQDKSFKGLSLTADTTSINTVTARTISFSGGGVGTVPVSIALNTANTGITNATLTGAGGFTGVAPANSIGGTVSSITIQATGLNGGAPVTFSDLVAGDTAVTAAAKINATLDAQNGGDGGITATVSGTQIVFTNTSGYNMTLGGDATTLTAMGFPTAASRVSTDGVITTPGVVQTVDQLVATINAHPSLIGKVKASNDGGRLHIDNISTEALTVVGATATAVNGFTGTTNTLTIGGNEVRKSLIAQFNELRQQLDRLAEDAGYNGVNLLKGDKLKLSFNEPGTSILEIQAKNSSGTPRPINTSAGSLNIVPATTTEFSDDALLEARIEILSDAITVVQTQSAAFGSSLSIVQVRQEFTKSMINTLEVGADNYTLADTNEEGANLLALNTRQQLSQTSLSLAAQAQQAVLRLFS